MKKLFKIFFLMIIGVLFFSGDFNETLSLNFSFRLLKDANAVVGRPLTPGSVAGVKRRTRRRTAAVTAAATTPVVVAAPAPIVVTPAPTTVVIGTTISALPGGCTTVTSGGATYHSCGGVYYKPAFQSDKVVYVVVEKPQ